MYSAAYDNILWLMPNQSCSLVVNLSLSIKTLHFKDALLKIIIIINAGIADIFTPICLV